jgi:hypothetical protein
MVEDLRGNTESRKGFLDLFGGFVCRIAGKNVLLQPV